MPVTTDVNKTRNNTVISRDNDLTFLIIPAWFVFWICGCVFCSRNIMACLLSVLLVGQVTFDCLWTVLDLSFGAQREQGNPLLEFAAGTPITFVLGEIANLCPRHRNTVAPVVANV